VDKSIDGWVTTATLTRKSPCAGGGVVVKAASSVAKPSPNLLLPVVKFAIQLYVTDIAG